MTHVKGNCTVTMSGGTLGVPRTLSQIEAHPVTCYLFGAGKGDQRDFFNESTNVQDVSVTVSGNTIIYGSVFGGGEDGHVLGNVELDINKGDSFTANGKTYNYPIIGTLGTSYVDGNIFGGGRGYSGEALTEGVVSGNIDIDITGGTMLGSVYGGGRLGSVGAYLAMSSDPNYGKLIPDGYKEVIDPVTGASSTEEAAGVTHGHITIDISDGVIGNNAEYVYPTEAQKTGELKNTSYDPTSNRLLTTKGGNVYAGSMGRLFLQDGTTPIKQWNDLGKAKSTTLNITGGTIKSSVYGGSELGQVEGSTTVNITGGSIGTQVPAGTGTNETSYYYGDVFGGGKGSIATLNYPDTYTEAQKPLVSEAGKVGGDVLVELNKGKTETDKGAVVNRIFGCNNINGSPKGNVTVHVYATQNREKGQIAYTTEVTDAKRKGYYDVAAVYGGGNEAAYIPTTAWNGTAGSKTQVIIEGCDKTSIEDVYGGGNAASVPETNVDIKSAYEIGTVFGGGNGKDPKSDGSANPGADVGVYKNTSNEDVNYGTGTTNTLLEGGHIHEAYGGSNQLGTIREKANVISSSSGDCDLNVEHIYGGGKNADMSGGTNIVLGCMPDDWIGEIYAGAKAANVDSDVSLTITSGKFERVYGGNMTSGLLKGAITVNIEETGTCPTPIIIGELYGGGYKADYSVYGYDSDGKAIENEAEKAEGAPYDNPKLNIRSFTSIGAIYGGGCEAKMVADPKIDINVVKGSRYDDATLSAASTPTLNLPYPAHEKGKIGAIGNVFGGGNLANVIGNTTVNVGTETTVGFVTEPIHLRTDANTPLTKNSDTGLYDITVEGANITGNVYGGGCDADIVGDAQVNICAKKGTGDTYTTVTPGSAGVTITGDVFGAGKGITTNVNNTKVVMAAGSVLQSVYGGGEYGAVDQNTNITITGGFIGEEENETGGEIIGNVYGGGKGQCDTEHLDAGLIKGNTTINISGGSIYHNIYGGGAYGSVGNYGYDEQTHQNTLISGGTANITITGGTIGINGKENGMVFGSSRGDVAKPSYGSSTPIDPNNLLAWVYDTNVIIGTKDAESGPHIKGSVYGSGENGHTNHNTSVTIHSGTIGITDTSIDGGAAYTYRGNVYGGGCGTDKYDSNNDGTKDSYNPIAGIVSGTAKVLIDGGQVVHNVYGAGAMGSVGESTDVTIEGNAVIGVDGNNNGNVYAAARGELGISNDLGHAANTELTINGGTIWGSAFGGGEAGIVKGAVTVNLTNGLVKQDVYGGGALAQTNTDYLSTDDTKKNYITTVNLGNATAGTTITGNLYGGGLGEKIDVNGGTQNILANVNGPVTVTVLKGKATNVFGCNNLNGSPQSSVAVNINGTDEATSPEYAIKNVYGGGNQADYTYTGNTPLTISMTDGIVDNIFGGGLSADVAGSIIVNVSGGTVVNDVYGGGALANTNTANWTPGTGDTGTLTENYYEVTVAEGTSVAGLYTESGGTYTATASTDKAVSGTKYYQKHTIHTTLVNLTGGLIGNAYGGGLGQGGTEPVEATVYGDVTVTANGAKFHQEDETEKESATYTEDGKTVTTKVTKYGRVFGANNISGTPKGDIMVHVIKTVPENGSNHEYNHYEIHSVYGGGNLSNYEPVEGKNTQVLVEGCGDTSIEYVYGGGNSASVPQTLVTVDGCYEIGMIFGGGNGDDPVKDNNGNWIPNPGANVKKSDGTLGTGTINAYRGIIRYMYGGSNKKGDCGTITENIHSAEDTSCPLKITNVYGAGNNADVNEVFIVAKCPGDNVEYLYGGSYNANIAQGVTLTLIGGKYTNVFGGNDSGGFIGGKITVNIQESLDCDPIIIENLYGGGNNAEYPGKGATGGSIEVNIKSCTSINNVFGGGRGKGAKVNGNTQVNLNMVPGYHAKKIDRDGTSGADNNAYALGAIGNVFGGGEEAEVNGNTEINIGTATTVDTMRIGKIVSGTTYYFSPVNSSGNPIYDIDGKLISGHTYSEIAYDSRPVLGAYITGDVYGGGNKAEVTSNTSVNIGTAIYEEKPSDFQGFSIGGSVYGGGCQADVKKNTRVTMADGYVFDGVYGGGLMGSVGTFTTTQDVTTESNNVNHASHAGCIGKPTACATGTGLCTVIVNGGQVGPVEVALEDGGMKNTHRYYKDPEDENDVGPVDYGFVFGAGRGNVENPAEDADADFRTYVNSTDVTIGGTALIMASVYGGGENGRVLGNTHVTIEGGQIGCSDVTGTGTNENPYVPKVYTEGQWETAINAVSSENPDPSEIDAAAANFKECKSWDYGKDVNNDGKIDYWPHDPYGSSGDGLTEANTEGSDGHSYYGSVFGGGSGYYPYYNKANGIHEWLRSAGVVYGNTQVDITGGHILTCVYGGNETTDVMGKCTVNFGGTATLGVPRTLADIAKHPVTCYLFGAGKGDQRVHFNTWTNVDEAEVNVTGGMIFGSVFGGGEDGHVLKNINVTISDNAKIGTWGTSYVDGNIFGGGRGFSGTALTAGSVGGNINVNISGGKMLGSVYGGGRLASVGIDFTPADDPSYGQLVDDTNEKTHGHITINISGGTIGTTTAEGTAHPVGGNVFGGSMGRITLLDETLNPLWPKQAVVKTSEISITGGTIWNSVYGGSEYGIVRDKATVTIGGTRDNSMGVVTPSGNPIIDGSVYGGGYGSDNTTPTLITAGEYATGQDYIFTPMIWTGCVSGDTEVNIAGGTVKKNVYGGGEIASVGLINCHVVEDANGDITIGTKKYGYTNITKHDDIQGTGTEEKAYGFALSWPYKFEFIPADPKSDHVGGKTTVNVTGGRIGTDYDNGTGYVFGASKGQVAFKKKDGDDLVNITDIHEQRYTEGFCANVRETEVNIKYSSTPDISTPQSIGNDVNCIMGAVYGGGEDGHVYEDAKVNITNGLIGLSVYGGGKGLGTYKGKLRNRDKSWNETLVDLPSWTAGKVYGNATVTMSGGHVLRNVFGGGYLGSVGKGNYASGADDYYKAGYGETLYKDDNNKENLWTSSTVGDNAWHFLNSGKTTVIISGGEVGTADGEYDGFAVGQIYGGSRGRAAEDVGALSPRYEYAPDFFLGYANNTEVKIGTQPVGTVGEEGYVPGSSPTIHGSVYGGGRDGHVRNSSHVIIYDGTIGHQYNASDTKQRDRGNVYGSGSGLGTWKRGPLSGHGSSSGSVTRNTTVDVYGGTIHQNVYGGGAMASVGPPLIPPTTSYAEKTWSLCSVNIHGGNIGVAADHDTYEYGGHVYGASRGGDNATGESLNDYATTIWNDVNITGGIIAGSVYGGGEAGRVKKDNVVSLTGGIIAHEAYGGGKGIKTSELDIAADVGGNTTVELNKGVSETAKGCVVKNIYGCNDLNGTPKGHVIVHVYGTQHKDKSSIISKYNPPYIAPGETGELLVDSLGRVIDATYVLDAEGKPTTTLLDGITEAVVTASKTTYTYYKDSYSTLTGDELTAATAAINTAITSIHEQIETLYDVRTVYGGGNLADYVPTDASSEDEATKNSARAEVIIDGCELTSIQQVYGGSNAACTPGTFVRVNGAAVIDEVFGGGNGKDPYIFNDKTYENPGANVGYYNYTTPKWNEDKNWFDAEINSDAITKEQRESSTYRFGSGIATTQIVGGRIHKVYGGSNMKGNISTTAVSIYQESGTCELKIDETYGGSKQAEIDGDTEITLDCVNYMANIYGGSKDADVHSNVTLNIANGIYDQVYGGNNRSGKIYGSITVNIQEKGCRPIIIGELYGGGYLANYSIYGYNADGTVRTKAQYDALSTTEKAAIEVMEDPRINIISATKIGTIYGGGYQATVVGNPHINVNMEKGRVIAKYANKTENVENYTPGEHTGNYPGTDPRTYSYKVDSHPENGDAILALGSIGDVFGGGNEADIYGNTYVDIGTGEWVNADLQREMMGKTSAITTPTLFKYNETTEKWTYVQTTGEGESATTTTEAIEGTPTPTRNEAVITGSVYGGGKMGHVGEFTFDENTTNDIPDGKPVSCAEGTGECHILISNGEIGPDNMAMFHLVNGNVPANDEPDNAGHVFGGCQGTTSPDDFDKAFADSTEVIINGTAFVKGSVFGGGENGHVLHNTGVKIGGDCQIGNGHILLTSKLNENDPFGTGTITANRGVNRRYTAAEWAAGHLFVENDPDIITDPKETALREAVGSNYTASLPECDSWLYGKEISGNVISVPTTPHHAPHDIFAGTAGYNSDGGSRIASDGRAFNGSVYGGGSGYFPYEGGKWLDTAGKVEGNTWVVVTGGHILTSLFGGSEMTSVDGDAHVIMKGGTLGVPRTLDEIAAHPVTCYVFGGGKGEGRSFLDNTTNVRNAYVNISGGWVYGSVFGGAEDGHVLGNVSVTINESTNGPESPTYADYYAGRATKIGTWGTSYVDGNIFGGGRGYDGNNLLAGCVNGNILTDISGGTMLGSIYGGGRMASVGLDFSSTASSQSGHFKEDETTGTNPKTYGHIAVNISGGSIGNDTEDILVEHTKGGNVFGGSMGRLEKLSGAINPLWPQLAQVKTADISITGKAHIKGNVYGGSELGTVRDSTFVTIGGTRNKTTGVTSASGSPIIERDVFGGGYGSSDGNDAHKASVNSKDANNNTIIFSYTPMQWAGIVGIASNVNIYGGQVKRNVYGGGEMASVGIINYEVDTHGVYKHIIKHDNEVNGFTLSWPYELPYIPGYEGTARVNICGGRIGLSGKDYMGPWDTSGNPTNFDNPILQNPVEMDNGDVYGGGKGLAGDRYLNAFCANVNNTEVNINYGTTPSFEDIVILEKTEYEWDDAGTNRTAKTKYSLKLTDPTNGMANGIAGSVYGGAENGHVLTDTKVNITGGYIGHGVYGGGKGKGTYEVTLNKINSDLIEDIASKPEATKPTQDDNTYTTKIYSILAGRVLGNTEVNMSGGWVMRNIYGGGNMASVGKGNYAGGLDDYSADGLSPGYGEMINGNLWTPSTNFNPNLPISSGNVPVTMADYFLGSGKTKVIVTGGTVGYLVNEANKEKKKVSSKDDLPTGNVFGGCRGESAPNVTETPRYIYCPAFFSGYVNETYVKIGKTRDEFTGENADAVFEADKGPTIYGSVYGGGQDGHVRRDTKVDINKGEIGIPYSIANQGIFGTDLDNLHWLHRGNVYGSGSGIGKYEYDFNYDGDYNDKVNYGTGARKTATLEKDFSTSAGSVTRFTEVNINSTMNGKSGNIIHRNVYGGGSLASIGPPKIGQDYEAYKKGDTADNHGAGKQSFCEVNVSGTVGTPDGYVTGFKYNPVYGGEVYGASRGDKNVNPAQFGTTVWTLVKIKNGATIMNNVFGGGDAGIVKKDSEVIVGGE